MKLSWSETKKIVRMYYDGVPINEVATIFNVSIKDIKDYIEDYRPSVTIRYIDTIPVEFGSKNVAYYDSEEDYAKMTVNNYPILKGI